MNNDLMNFSIDLQKDMLELKKIGVDIPARAFEMAKDLEYIEEYQNMKTSACVDLLISLAQIETSAERV